MADLATLITLRDKLVLARLSDVREIEDQNGERIVYRSDAEMARAIAAAEREIARLQGTARPGAIKLQTSKGS